MLNSLVQQFNDLAAPYDPVTTGIIVGITITILLVWKIVFTVKVR